MDRELRDTILGLLSEQKDMSLATIRGDGYPQATMVSYVNDVFDIYFGAATFSQKAKNIANCSKVSLTITAPHTTWNDIRGLSVGGRAARVTQGAELLRVQDLMRQKFLELSQLDLSVIGTIAFFRVTPKIITVLDYSRGIGHSDSVAL